GIYKYLERNFSDFKQRGFVVGYDTRGQVTSNCSSKKYEYPYAVQQLGAVAGVMITASHNRKEDNGYKVYWENGAQITSPHDKEIIKCIEECVEPWNGSWNENLVDTSPLRQDPLKKICDSYMEDLTKICFHRELNVQSNLKFVHTSFHGVGHDYVQLAFKAFGFQPPIPVPEQKDPDPDFSTVKCPNPEEGECVLELSLRLAEKENAKVVVATDPDADRLAVAEQQEKETLPGFKWIGSRVKNLLDNGNEVLFAFEESIGFMCGTSVLDKDGVSAAVVIAEMATYLQGQNLSLAHKLLDIYETYGYHISRTSYFLCYDPATIKRIFERLRNFEGPQSYPKCCGTYSILHVRDITTGYDSSQLNKRSVSSEGFGERRGCKTGITQRGDKCCVC
ncbi:glucose 1,6-bisphosphate synthase, partial [Malurus melanocephalus]|uniref:glucose 1,6-bisphosphate synthase n=1 Tax=Malurus melanocephalus TaxID=175006 RepID=UPI002546D078